MNATHHKKIWLFLVVWIMLVFGRILHNGFVNYDDFLHISANDLVTSRGYLEAWKQPYFGMYIPVTYNIWKLLWNIETWLGWQVHPPFLFHFASLLLHIFNALLVFLLLRRWKISRETSLLAVLFFLLHPMQVESVAWISELRGLLSASFGLIALLFFFSAGKNRKDISWLFPVFLFLSFLSKPVGVVFLLPAFGGWVWRRDSRRHLIWWFTGLLGAIPTFLFTRSLQSKSTSLLWIWEKLYISFDTIGFTIWKVLWPFSLAVDYGRTPQSVLKVIDFRYPLLALFLGLLAIFTALKKYDGWKENLGSFAWFLVFLIPTSGVITFSHQVFSSPTDRYAYLSLLGWSFFLAFFLSRFSNGVVRQFLVLSILLFYSVLSWNQVAVWKNSFSLFGNALKVNPESRLAHHFRGQAAAGMGLYQEAIWDFNQTLKIDSSVVDAWYWKGKSFLALGNIDSAQGSFSRALSMNPAWKKVCREAMKLPAPYRKAEGFSTCRSYFKSRQVSGTEEDQISFPADSTRAP